MNDRNKGEKGYNDPTYFLENRTCSKQRKMLLMHEHSFVHGTLTTKKYPRVFSLGFAKNFLTLKV